MKKITIVLLTIFSVGLATAQSKEIKKQKEFVETYRLQTGNVKNVNLQLLQNKYYLESKNMILEQQKKLSKDQVNELLIYNQDEFYKALKNEFWKGNMRGENAKSANNLYEARLPANLDAYRSKVIDKLDSILAS
ncbi:hypothetical protein [Chryseobacterium caseinilyticum]|uniref:DUF4142 domain-containing protein n=1 Tax=Chryseobacterium caseinilyticum TaxID=2771428 RepID=A0ABR8Z6V7_9FLAO|nr:hypothetical protein [Chryseobacterium caseinilyticum]MBD8080937.1 hypothetical protein [Chryseobacterium caseinilyticum]